MSTTSESTGIELEVVVDVPVEHAFRVFTEDFDRIKPREHNLMEVPIAETVLETHVGGRIYDRGEDGSVCAWARVLAFEPPHRLVFSWDLSPEFELESDPARTSEVEVAFTAQGEESTLVRLEHRHFDRHGEGWQEGLSGVAGEGGWPLYLERFAALARTSS